MDHIRHIEAKKREKKARPMFHAQYFDQKKGKTGVRNQNDVHEPWVVLFFLVFLLLYVLYDLLEHIYNVFSLGQCHFHNMKQPPLILHRGQEMIQEIIMNLALVDVFYSPPSSLSLISFILSVLLFWSCISKFHLVILSTFLFTFLQGKGRLIGNKIYVAL